MAASPSSASGGNFAVWLYDENFNRIQLVDIAMLNVGAVTGLPIPQTVPPLLSYQGALYVWSNVHGGYQRTAPQVPVADLGSPQLSVLANPQT